MVNSFLYSLLFALAATLYETPLALASSDAVIFNGDFEKGKAKSIAQNWKDNSGWADVDVRYEKIYSLERKGYVQKIICENFEHGAVQFVQKGVTVRSGVTYKVKFWAKGTLEAPLEVLLRKHGKPYTRYDSKAFRITGEWKEYTFNMSTHVDDSSAYFMFKFTSEGVVLLDDISVVPVTSSISKKTQHYGNLVSNGNFEIGTDKWGVEYRGISYEHEMSVRALELRAFADSERSKFGSQSIKIPSTLNSRFNLNSEYIFMRPDIKHTLSMWVYSETERNLRIGIKSGYFGNSVGSMAGIKVGPKWRRYEISTLLMPSRENAYFVAVDGSGAGSVWIDAIQVIEGESKPFKNKFPLEIGFAKEKNHPIFSHGEEISLQVSMVAHSHVDDCNARVNSTDYYGNVLTIYDGSCSLDKGTSSLIDVVHTYDKPGYYRLTAEIQDKNSIHDRSEYAIGVINNSTRAAESKAISSPFGGHARFALGDLEDLSSMGVKWLRMHPPLGTKWSIVENNKGLYKYPDNEVALAKNNGFEILGTLDQTPRWASVAPKNDSGYWAFPPDNYDDWEQYVFNIVSHYKGVIDYWEVWNEPDSGRFLKLPEYSITQSKPDVYVELLKRAYKAAKKANPDAIIIGGCSTSKPHLKWLKSIFELDALNYMDIVSLHYYTGGRPGDVLDRPISEDIQEIKQAVYSKTGKGLPIWETESGIIFPKTSYKNLIQISPSYLVPDTEAVAYLVRNYVHLLKSGVSKWFYYSMFTSHKIDRIDATGFFEWDGAPRPLAIAYAVLAKNLQNLHYTDSIDYEAVQVDRFTGDARDVAVIAAKTWSENTKVNIQYAMEGVYKSIDIMNVMGNRVKNIKSGENVNLEAGREPLYIIGYK